MGWTFQDYTTRKETIEHLTEGWTSTFPNGGTRKNVCLAKQFKGSCFKGTLYAVFEMTEANADGSVLKQERWIFVAMMQYSNYEGRKSWGYKDMDESCGPYEDGCPKKYMAMVPCPDQPWARAFRARCMLKHELNDARRQINRKIRKSEITYAAGMETYNKAKEEYRRKLDELRVKSEAEDKEYEAKREAERKAAEPVAAVAS